MADVIERMTFDELAAIVRRGNSARVCTDSRDVRRGDVFIAVKGSRCDGHDYIRQAVANGARYIVCESCPAEAELASSIKLVRVADTAAAAGRLAQAANGEPAKKLTNLAVTGTNGKTTVAFLVRSCVQAAGEKCGLIGTVVYDTGLGLTPANLTTPDTLTVAEKQAEMVTAGAKYMVIEASSHSLDQNRLAGIDFTAAAFTNLTGDHLDYHGTKEKYLEAKSRLFESLGPDATAVLNRQSAEAKDVAKRTRAKIVWFAVDEPADLSGRIESMDITGTVFTFCRGRERARIKTALLGRYNVSNHLAAAGLTLAAGIPFGAVAKGLGALAAIPGRLEKVECDGDFTVLVDFAHTDDALKNVLSTLKPLCKGKLIVVFGCGGDRDRTKRPRMAKVTEELADTVIVTSDNPRTEKPEEIIRQIVAGFRDPHCSKITVEADRRKAIGIALENAGKRDVVVIAGKGHETYQIVGTQKFDFSDKEVVLDWLGKRK